MEREREVEREREKERQREGRRQEEKRERTRRTEPEALKLCLKYALILKLYSLSNRSCIQPNKSITHKELAL